MNISFKCKCGRTTTYGLKCVTCSGPTLEFVSRSSIQDDDDSPEDNSDRIYERKDKKRTSSLRPPKVEKKFYAG